MEEKSVIDIEDPSILGNLKNVKHSFVFPSFSLYFFGLPDFGTVK